MSIPGVVLVDDHLLLRILLGDEPPELRPSGAQVVTTGLWYHRLCRALRVPGVTGVLTRNLGRADESVSAGALAAVTALPAAIGLVSLGELAWPMAHLLAEGVRLNLLSLEALAAAQTLGATICLGPADVNPPLVAAAAGLGTDVRLVA